jgi:hypothetical protein
MPLRRLSAVLVLSAFLAVALSELVRTGVRAPGSVAALCDSGGQRPCP